MIGLTIPSTIHSGYSEALHNPLSSLSETSSKDEIIVAIRYIAIKYGVSDLELIKTLQCESGFNNEAIGKAGEIGIAQFMPTTWEQWNKQRNTTLEIHRISNQIEMAAWAFEKGYQRAWTCWRTLFGNQIVYRGN